MKTNRYPGWAGVCSFDPATEPVEVHEVCADVLPDEIAAVLALTPHAAEDTPWAEREQLAAAVADAGAAGLAESYGWWFAEKPVKYEENGDCLWA